MDTTRILLAEYEQQHRQDAMQLAAAEQARRAECHDDHTLRATLADCLFALATWVAPAGAAGQGRALARG